MSRHIEQDNRWKISFRSCVGRNRLGFVLTKRYLNGTEDVRSHGGLASTLRLTRKRPPNSGLFLARKVEKKVFVSSSTLCLETGFSRVNKIRVK